MCAGDGEDGFEAGDSCTGTSSMDAGGIGRDMVWKLSSGHGRGGWRWRSGRHGRIGG